MKENSKKCQSLKPALTIKKGCITSAKQKNKHQLSKTTANHKNMHMTLVPSCTRRTVMKDVTPHSTLPSCLRVV